MKQLRYSRYLLNKNKAPKMDKLPPIIAALFEKIKTVRFDRHSLLSIALLAAALTSLAMTARSSQNLTDRTSKMNNPSPKIEALFQKTKTVCFGRFMIDLPESAQLVWGPMAVPYKLSVYPGEGYKLKAEIKTKVDKITSEKHKKEPSMLIGVFDSVNPDSKIVVGYEDRHDTLGAQLYSYIRLDKTAFVQSRPSAPLVVTDKSARMGVREDKTRYKEYVEQLLNVACRLRLRDENEIPDEPGVCIEEGFIASPLDFESERIAIGFRFPELPDVSLAVDAISTDRPTEDDTLEAALKGGQEGAKELGLSSLYSRIKTLRKKDRLIGKWDGAEALSRLPSKDGSPETHDFMFIAPGVAKDMLRPFVKIMFYTGVKGNARGQVQPSLTDEEAIAMWDKLTSSIRVRPVKGIPSDGETKPDAPAPEARAPAAALRLSTGDKCPKTGPWRCVEDGGTLPLKEGQLMPRATFFKPATGFLNRIKGVKQVYSHDGPGHWEWAGEEKKG
jgi:hypothetical protein